ncbi:cytochrome c [Oleiagrimonas citrea]|uniref:C-type cytochrome n=1 Tax=Oleiagrimonas citrea TaxID=1665687 RepID=A0A846ZLP8_9GAMM|nr:cytochrome c [Oleiagrimonas citrea]NKZ38742.1 c-type cytochrome [Oleiagrimonas citrea]
MIVRWKRYAALGMALVLTAVVLGAATASGEKDSSHGRTGHEAASAVQIARGKYLVRAGDCIACHTAPGGQPFAGNRMIPTPFGVIYTANLTPDKATGLGDWSVDDFWRAMHLGRGRDGRLLYPAFPYPSYTKIRRADVEAMYAYLRTLKPVHSRTNPPELSFPYSWRRLLLGWRALYFDAGEYVANPKRTAQWNRGAYLVQGLGHCSACHTPRNALGARKSGQALRGGMIPEQGWYAPDLAADAHGGLAGWSEQDIVDLLKTGRSRKGTAYGPMAEVVQNSLQYLRNSDLHAMAVYLRSLPSRRAEDSAMSSDAEQLPAKTATALVARGRVIYRRDCSACHQKDGRGVANVYPPLAGNSVVRAANPVNPVRAVLLGGFEPTTAMYPRPYSMPPYAQRLSDRDVAAVVSYIRQAWGNAAAPVSPSMVGEYRSIPIH